MNIQIHKVYQKRDLTLKTLGYPNNRHTHITCIYPMLMIRYVTLCPHSRYPRVVQ